jgi:hypothetical protein
MNERTFYLVFTLGPTVSAREKNSSTGIDIFNRASHPFRSSPLAHPLRKGHEPDPVIYCTLPRL